MSKILMYTLLVVMVIFPCCRMTGQSGKPDSLLISEGFTKYEYQIPMRDGVKLYTIVYVPKDTSELHPIMFTRTPYSIGPYGKDNYYKSLSNLSRYYFLRNYIMVYQDVRGRYMSEGTFVDVRPYIPVKKSNNDIDESSDAYDTIDWLIKNIPHNNGKVGVKGSSYPGFYTTMATIGAHPAVKATSPQAPVSEWMKGDDWIHNGAFLLPHFFDFYSNFGWQRPKPTEHDSHGFTFGTSDGYQFFMNLGALSNINPKYYHDSVAFWNEFSNHPKWDAFWQQRDVLPHVKNLTPATMVVGGWFDTENLFGALHLSAEITKDNPNGNHTLVMGPWGHGWWLRNDVDSLGPIKFGMNVSNFYAESLEVPYFDYYLRGKANPNLPAAVVFETGADRWMKFDQWPPQNLESKKLFLGGKGAVSFDQPKADENEYDEYVSNPDKPVPYTNEIRHWYNAAFMVEDQRFVARRPDVLVYQSDILKNDMTIAGPITAHIVGSTSGTDCDWVVKVIDVFPDTMKDTSSHMPNVQLGGYEMLVRGDVLRGKFRNSIENPEPIPPNKPTTFEYPLQDIFHDFKKGHRIMVQVQSTWFPMIDRNPGKFLDIYHAKDSDFQKTVQRVYHSTKRASYLTVSVYR
ncbi:MAG: CocE/NonD family hydrolase [Bacteroidota bacterium]